VLHFVSFKCVVVDYVILLYSSVLSWVFVLNFWFGCYDCKLHSPCSCLCSSR